MPAHLIEHLTTDRHVTMPFVKGGETAESSKQDAAIMEPWPGKYEDVFMRVFGLDGNMVEIRFSADDMRQALELVAELRRRESAASPRKER